MVPGATPPPRPPYAPSFVSRTGFTIPAAHRFASNFYLYGPDILGQMMYDEYPI